MSRDDRRIKKWRSAGTLGELYLKEMAEQGLLLEEMTPLKYIFREDEPQHLRYRIEELESRLIRVINDLHQNTYSQYYLGELNFITEGITVTKRYGTALAGLCFVDFVLPESPMKDED